MLYTVTAFALAFLWMGALALSPSLDIVFKGGTEEIFSLPKELIWILFPIISVSIALTFKHWILTCKGWRIFLPALVLPWIGTFVIAVACGIAAHTMCSDPNGGFFGALWFAVLYTLLGFWIVIPMGLLSQVTLLGANKISNIGKTEQEPAPNP